MNLIRHKVLDLIRQDILTCELMPGAELREAELAERYNVSKSPVRVALQRLEFEGLIEIEPRRGHRVAPISVSDTRDILEMRETLEVSAAKLIAERATDAQLAGLDGLRSADTSNVAAFAEYNQGFHLAVAELSGNARLAQEMRRLLEAYDRLCVVSLNHIRDDRGSMETPLAEHNQIIDALQARDARTAARIIRKHIGHSRTHIMRGLERRPIVD